MSLRLLPLALVLVACTAKDGGDDDTDTDVTEQDEPCDVEGLDPLDGVDCDGTLVTLTGEITDDLTITPDLTWILQGGVFIGDDESETVLTIEPGSVIYGDSATDGFLVVQRHSRILAEGTAADPIVFTSDQNEGSRGPSDWGGLVINGNATTNVCSPGQPCDIPGEAGTGFYGGDDDGDDSGVLSYVRVEFAGTLVNDRQEINGVAFQGVGSGTTIDHLHAHRVADDGVEFFGGAVDAKHLIITGSGDDGLDWTDGWRGRAQYVFVQLHGGDGDNGIEADNNGDNNASVPRSAPQIANITLLGGQRMNEAATDAGMLLREGTHVLVQQAVVAGWGDACADIDHPSTWGEAWDVDNDMPTGDVVVRDVVYHCPDLTETAFPTDGDDIADIDAEAFFLTHMDGVVEADPMLGAPYDEASPDPVPDEGSPALGATPTAAPDAWFDTTDYLGAFGDTDWTDWTAYPVD